MSAFPRTRRDESQIPALFRTGPTTGPAHYTNMTNNQLLQIIAQHITQHTQYTLTNDPDWGHLRIYTGKQHANIDIKIENEQLKIRHHDLELMSQILDQLLGHNYVFADDPTTELPHPQQTWLTEITIPLADQNLFTKLDKALQMLK